MSMCVCKQPKKRAAPGGRGLTCVFFFLLSMVFIPAEAGARISGALHADSAGTGGPAAIGSVAIIRYDIFASETGELIWLKKLANRFHIKSRESVIGRELLFAAGDTLAADVLEETERNLRKLPFLGDVFIAAEEDANGARNVRVETHDQWTTLLEFSAGREGGRNKFRFGLAERNFLGYGQNVGVRYKVLDTGNFMSFKFAEPRFFGARWMLHLEKIQGEDRNFFVGDVIRPLYSLNAKWSAGFSAARGSAKARWYEAGDETDAFRSGGTSVEGYFLRSFGARYKKTNVKFGCRYFLGDYSAYEYTRNPGLVTPRDEYHSLGIGLERDVFSFVEETRIDKFSRVEDIKLGSRWEINLHGAGRTFHPADGRARRFMKILAVHELGIMLPGPQYILGSASFSSRIEQGRFRHAETRVDLRYYNRFLPAQTLAAHVEMMYGTRLDRGWQYLLGEDEGLRGYPSFRFSGQKFLLFNLEDRIFTPLELLWTGIGAAVFVDGGYAWKESLPVRVRDMKCAAGIGLRLGLNKSSGSRVVRIDLARAFDGSGYLVSVASDHVFYLNRLRSIFLFPGQVF